MGKESAYKKKKLKTWVGVLGQEGSLWRAQPPLCNLGESCMDREKALWATVHRVLQLDLTEVTEQTTMLPNLC